MHCHDKSSGGSWHFAVKYTKVKARPPTTVSCAGAAADRISNKKEKF
jgi:hypothetical protein